MIYFTCPLFNFHPPFKLKFILHFYIFFSTFFLYDTTIKRLFRIKSVICLPKQKKRSRGRRKKNKKDSEWKKMEKEDEEKEENVF